MHLIIKLLSYQKLIYETEALKLAWSKRFLHIQPINFKKYAHWFKNWFGKSILLYILALIINVNIQNLIRVKLQN